MEGVGARLGRSSTRYGPATVFTGPVRKWKKKWVHVSSSSSSSSSSSAAASTASNSNGSANHSHHQLHGGSALNGANGSQLVLYKWTPITQSQNASAVNNGNGDAKAAASAKDEPAASAKDEPAAAAAVEEPPRRKFKYVPIAVLEEQKYDAAEDEAAEKESDEGKPVDTNPSAKDENLDEKPDINDVPMDENEDTNKVVCQDLNESTLDLSLGLNGHDSDNEGRSKDADCRDS